MSATAHRRADDSNPRDGGDSDHPASAADESDAALLEKGEMTKPETPPPPGARQLAFCFVGLQASYLTWGYVQEKVMTKEYATGKFPSATFCVFSNRILAVAVAAAITLYQHRGRLAIPASYIAFAPCALSNSLSSFGQYQALHYVSFPLQTIAKSTKVIPVMLMGKVLNKKNYPCVDYLEAAAICMGVSLFSLANLTAKEPAAAGADEAGGESALVGTMGVLMLALYVVSDSFTSQWQSRLYQAHPQVDQFQMMFAVNTWAIMMTMFALVTSGELWITLAFIRANPIAFLDNVMIAITSATGQLFIFYTIKTFGPVVFTIIMTTRQMFSIVLSTVIFGHAIKPLMFVGAMVVFATIFNRIKRQAKLKRKPAALPEPPAKEPKSPARGRMNI